MYVSNLGWVPGTRNDQNQPVCKVDFPFQIRHRRKLGCILLVCLIDWRTVGREAKYKQSGRRGGRWVRFPRDPFWVGEFGGFDFPGVDLQCVNQYGITSFHQPTAVRLPEIVSGLFDMADRTAANLFRTVFKLLAETPTEEHKDIAGKIFAMTGDYDFNEYQMNADEACVALGLAQEYSDPIDGDLIVWPGDHGFDESR